MWAFNGCSFVENSHLELEDQEWDTRYWPKLIAEHYNADFVNLAASGASNSRIFRTTVDYIYAHNPEVIIIGWSGNDREELPCANGDRVRLRPDCTSFENDQGSLEYLVHEYWYKNHHNEWLMLEQFLHQILIIQDLCAYRNIRCYMFNSFWHNNIPHWTQPFKSNFNVQMNKLAHKYLDELEHVKALGAQIDFDRWIWNPPVTLAQWAQQNQLQFESLGHPSLAAQQEIANYIISRIKEIDYV